MSSSPTSSTSIKPQKITSDRYKKTRRKSVLSSSLGSFFSGKSRRKQQRLSPTPKNPYELSSPERKRKQRAMVRTVSKDDELLFRGANPRTGVISPWATGSLESGQDYVDSRPHQGPRQAQGKWQQDKRGWSFVDSSNAGDRPASPVEMEAAEPKERTQSLGDAELFRRYQAELQRGIQSCGTGDGLKNPFEPDTPRESSAEGRSSPRPSLFKIKRKPVARDSYKREGSTSTVIINGQRRYTVMDAPGRLMREGHVNIVTPKHSPPTSLPPSKYNKKSGPFLGQRQEVLGEQNRKELQAEHQKAKLSAKCPKCERHQGLCVVSCGPQPELQNQNMPRTPKQMSGNEACRVLPIITSHPLQVKDQPVSTPLKRVRFSATMDPGIEESYKTVESRPGRNCYQEWEGTVSGTNRFEGPAVPIGMRLTQSSCIAPDAPITTTITTTTSNLRSSPNRPFSNLRPEPSRSIAMESIPRVKQQENGTCRPAVHPSLKTHTLSGTFISNQTTPTLLYQPTTGHPAQPSSRLSNETRQRGPAPPPKYKMYRNLHNAGEAALNAMKGHRRMSGGLRDNMDPGLGPDDQYLGWVTMLPPSPVESERERLDEVPWCRGASGSENQEGGKERERIGCAEVTGRETDVHDGAFVRRRRYNKGFRVWRTESIPREIPVAEHAKDIGTWMTAVLPKNLASILSPTYKAVFEMIGHISKVLDPNSGLLNALKGDDTGTVRSTSKEQWNASLELVKAGLYLLILFRLATMALRVGSLVVSWVWCFLRLF